MKVVGFKRTTNFALGCGGISVPKEQVFLKKDCIISWSGVGHHDVFQYIVKNNLNYFYIDTGYIGNKKQKTYKRITFNGLNDNRNIIDRPDDRLKKISIDRSEIKRGNKILVIPPDQKVLNCWGSGIDLHTWIQNIVTTINSYTGREIVIRERPHSRSDRLTSNTFLQALHDDIHAVVVWSSNCAVESVLHNIPVVSVGPTATRKVSPYLISQIDNIPDLEIDLVNAWLRHISYCQFTETEMLQGLAWEYLRP